MWEVETRERQSPDWRFARHNSLEWRFRKRHTSEFTGCGKSSLFCHSEQSEESLFALKTGNERFLGAQRAFGMTKMLVFPQAVKPDAHRSRRAARKLVRVIAKRFRYCFEGCGEAG
jgi:hypothetical protein